MVEEACFRKYILKNQLKHLEVRTVQKSEKKLIKFRFKCLAFSKKNFACSKNRGSGVSKGRIFSEKEWYYLHAQTDMPFHHLKLVI